MILRELVRTLPACTICHNPATKAWQRGEARFCDECGEGVPDYPRAPSLREALRLLKEIDAHA